MAFKLKHTNVQNMLGKGPKMYKEEGPAMYADKESAGPKAMKPDFIDIDKDGNTTESMKSAAKSKGPKSHKKGHQDTQVAAALKRKREAKALEEKNKKQ